MKFSRSIVLAVALIFAWATAGFAAHSAEICQKRIESFNYLVDYSGSMMMNFPSVGKTKMAVATTWCPNSAIRAACTPSLLMARS